MKTVVIIGTIHKPTNNYSKYDLLNLLEKIKPSLLLEELPDSFYDASGKRKIKRNFDSQEEYAIDTYAKKYNIKILPYDVHDRQEIIKNINLFENNEKVFEIIDGLLENDDLTIDQRNRIEECYNYFEMRDEIIKNGTWREINSTKFDEVNDNKEEAFKKLYLEVVPSHRKLVEYIDYCKKCIEFWDIRNRRMCENINRLAIEDGITAVLVGVEHKSIFLRLLKDYREIKYYSIESL